jgi:4'-phosphopantetheinyl transferase EntD
MLTDGNGAPDFQVDGHPALGDEGNLSIAHHEGLGVCALGRTARDGLVGVDVEGDRPITTRLLRRILTSGELARMSDDHASPPPPPPPIALWALKEAVLKSARGVPCRSMREIELSCADGDDVSARLLTPRVASSPRARITARYRMLHYGAERRPYVVAVASCRLSPER